MDPGIDDLVEQKPTAEDRERFPKPPKTLLPTGKLKGEGTAKPKETLTRGEKIIKDPYPDFNDPKVQPYKIYEKDFGDLDDWDTLELILWGDGTVTTDDSMCEMVSPTLLFKLLPEGWPNQFFEDGKPVDTIYYRNNKERRDIQIIKDSRTYREWIEEVWPGRLSELDDG